MAGSASETSHPATWMSPGSTSSRRAKMATPSAATRKMATARTGSSVRRMTGLAAPSRVPIRHVAATISAMTSTSRSG